MNQKRKWFLTGLLFSIMTIFILSGWVGQVQAQEKYPTRAIDIIVPTGPGGSNDITARLIAAFLAKNLGTTVNVINKPGGNLIPASLEVHNAAPDGYTLLLDNIGPAVIMPASTSDLPFNVMDRTFVAILARYLQLFAVPSKSPFKSLKDVEIDVKKNPDKFVWVSLPGTSTDYIMKQFFKAIDVDIKKTRFISVSSGGQTATVVASGDAKLGVSTSTTFLPTFQSGLIKPIAITSPQRDPGWPDVTTTAEQGYPTVNGSHWVGISGPPKLPSYIIDILGKAFKEMLNDAEWISKLKKIDGIPFYLNQRETREFILKQSEEARELAK